MQMINKHPLLNLKTHALVKMHGAVVGLLGVDVKVGEVGLKGFLLGEVDEVAAEALALVLR